MVKGEEAAGLLSKWSGLSIECILDEKGVLTPSPGKMPEGGYVATPTPPTPAPPPEETEEPAETGPPEGPPDTPGGEPVQNGGAEPPESENAPPETEDIT